MSLSLQIGQVLHNEMATVSSAVVRLVIAGLLGGLIGLEREYKHRAAGLRTNMFMCIGSCLFTILSVSIAINGHDDHTRIAAQIVAGIGFIGAGAILHERKEFVTGLTSAATIFVVAAVGMAVGGGLYLTATFATLIVIGALFLLGKSELRFNLKLLVYVYEVTGPSADEMSLEVNRVLEPKRALMHNRQVAPTPDHVRMQFELEGTRELQEEYLRALRESKILRSAASLGPLERE
jgi:putative Mg2+ transporter-C (MgtC) family protein